MTEILTEGQLMAAPAAAELKAVLDRQRAAFQAAGEPIISVDTKKRFFTEYRGRPRGS